MGCSHGKNDATHVVAGFDAAVSVGDVFEGDHGVDEWAQRCTAPKRSG